jgi:hypothetical protein
MMSGIYKLINIHPRPNAICPARSQDCEPKISEHARNQFITLLLDRDENLK